MKKLCNVGKALTNQRGIAIVLAILLLMVITLFGAIGITMSTREIRGAGSKRLNDQRFYDAEMATTEFLLQPKEWLNSPYLNSPVTSAIWPEDKPKEITVIKNGAVLANIRVVNIQNDDPALAAARGLPLQPHTTEPGEGYSLGKFQARRFSITSVTPDGRSQLREGVWRAFNK